MRCEDVVKGLQTIRNLVEIRLSRTVRFKNVPEVTLSEFSCVVL